MIWWLIGIGVVLIVFGFVAARPMRIPREPEREGAQDREAVAAYDRSSRGLTFIVERFIIMRALARRPPRGVLVDLGCGPGYLAARISRRYPSVKVIGVDVNPDMLATAKKNWPPEDYPNLSFIFGDAERLPLARSKADTVVSSVSLHHWRAPLAAFTDISRVLGPEGGFLLFDLRRDSPRVAYWALAIGQFFTPAAIRRTNGAVGSFWSAYTVPELTDLFKQAGWPTRQISRGPAWLVARVPR